MTSTNENAPVTATSAIEARRLGVKTFLGAPCAVHSSGIRFAHTGACVDCVMVGLRKATLASTSPESRAAAAQSRREARENGKTHYASGPCSTCGGTERYSANGTCANCQRGKDAGRKRSGTVAKVAPITDRQAAEVFLYLARDLNSAGRRDLSSALHALADHIEGMA